MIKNLPVSARDARDKCLIPRSERFPGVGNGNPLLYSWLGSPIGQRSLAGYSLWGHNESDTTEQPSPHSIRSSHGKNILFVCLSRDLSNDLFLDFNGRRGLYF